MDVMAETEIRSTRLPRNSSLGTNFSYPKPTMLSRHESRESRSSVASNGSLPGMTDASDSDVSFDDDCNYNTSANELWDRFWPDSTLEQEQQYPAVLRASRGRDYFNVHSSGRRPQETEDETIKVPQLSHGYVAEQPAATRPATKRSPVSYSVYPRPSRTDIRRVELPPRTSSLNPDLSSYSQRKPFLKTVKSSAALKSSKSAHSLHHLYLGPPSAAPTAPLPSLPTTKKSSSSSAAAYLTIPTTTAAAKPVAASTPVSPAYPPPPVPNTLRPSNSAFTLRENQHSRQSPQLPNSHNMTAPLTPLLKSPPSLPRSQYHQQQQQQQQRAAPSTPVQPKPEPQRFVSVFEFDSDDEDDGDRGSGWGRRGSGSSSSDGNSNGNSGGDAGSRLAKRIARGLGHKKSASEKRGRTAGGGYGIMPPTPVLGSGGFEDNREKSKERGGSLSRKRGGSLGRIFGGLMSR